MELRFIWIEDYKNIEKIGFNFNNSLNEEFQFDNGNLIISSKDNITPENFYKANFSSVTAIVGKNGSGKTNLTEFINYGLAHIKKGLYTYFKLSGFFVVDNLIFIQKEIDINNIQELESKGFKILKYNNVPLDLNVNQEVRWDYMEMNKYIYYSPTFDLRMVKVSDNLFNISTTNLIYNDLYKSEKLLRKIRDISPLESHESMENLRMSDFLLNFKSIQRYIEFLPEKIQITLDHEEKNYFLRPGYDGGESNSLMDNQIENFKKYIVEGSELKPYIIEKDSNYTLYRLSLDSYKKMYNQLFFLNVFQVLVYNNCIVSEEIMRYFIFDNSKDNIPEVMGFEKVFSLLSTVDNFVKELLNAGDFDGLDIKIDSSSFILNERFVKFCQFFGVINVPLDRNIRLINRTRKSIKKLLDDKEILSYCPMSEFSSGQRQLLSIYSRFYWTKKQIILEEKREGGIFSKSLIIFIDEGEVALHPEWQRKFFNKISTFLSELFSDRTIQLILTTHSPFVLSDIPKNDVLFLNTIDALSDSTLSKRDNTFGANIYSLLADSFFMDSTIGEFAEEKVKWVLKMLKEDQGCQTEELLDEMKFIINSIGEPLIQEQLSYLFNKKFNKKDDELRVLRKRIIELENQLKKN